MNIKESGEMYLEAIYVLNKKTGNVRSIDICDYLGYSKPSVSRAMSLLKNGGYVIMDTEGFLSLTDLGVEIAEKIYNRHTTLTDLLVKLGVTPETAAQDACKMEHIISDETFNAIKRHIEKNK
ncbi:MAG: metal-dependent transcriptional regulator [Acutalibacteraceae bacterium]|nr:metal-dependent transcriptional regulator [Acutalibacteraceae bacterium]